MPLLVQEVPVSRALWLPKVLRAAGLTVHEIDGWEDRGAGTFGPIVGLTCHETRGSRTSTDAGEINVLVNGRVGLSGPISQTYLSRTGDWHIVASGTAHHNKVGWAGPNEGYGNDALIGVEAQHAEGEPWTDVQYRSYVRGVAAIIRHLGISPSRVGGHKEHQPGEKTDPAFDMDQFRRDVAAVLAGEDPDDMTRDEFIEHFKAAMSDPTVTALMRARPWQYPVRPGASALNVLFVEALPQLAAAVKGLGEIVARESSNPAEVKALLAALPQPQVDSEALAAALAPKLVASLPADSPITDEQLARVLRSVLGSLDATQG